MSDEEKRLEGQRLLALIQAQQQDRPPLLAALDALTRAAIEDKPNNQETRK